jgi:acetyltransferase-like isoleucine patch superfamily enzyme
VRRDHRPYFVKKLRERFEHAWVERFIRPQLESLGDGFLIMRPWNLLLNGPNIFFGNNVHVITASYRKVVLSTWEHDDGVGRIDIGDAALICPDVRIDAATTVSVGANCMLASGCYLSDADWHDLYDRTRPVGNTRPITLGGNVWLGDGVTVCKGVTIGENSVIGTGAVVANDIPADVIAAGNPARPIRELDREREIVRRSSIFEDPQALRESMDRVDRWILHSNSFTGWLRHLVRPRRGD